MDKRLSTRALMAVIAITLALTILAFWLPSALRVRWVASMGVLTANTVTLLIQVIGVVCGLVAVGLGGYQAVQAIARKRTADLAALETRQWDALPSRDETDPKVIEPALHRVAKRYPETAQLIEITFEQLESVRRSLDKIGDIFEANAGIITQEPDRYGNIERLVKLLYERICPGLVRIVYQAHEQDDTDAAIHDLVEVINKVNDDNQVRVDNTRKLANAVVAASTEGDIDNVTAQVEDATRQLTSPTKKEDWL